MKEFSKNQATAYFNEFQQSKAEQYETFEEFVFDKIYSDTDTFNDLIDEDDSSASTGEQVEEFVRFCERILDVELS